MCPSAGVVSTEQSATAFYAFFCDLSFSEEADEACGSGC